MKNKQISFFSFSFGCRINQAETEAINLRLIEAGLVFCAANPNIYIINTCAVTGKAEREARQHIYQIKRKFPKTYLVVTGCSATFWMKNNTFKDMPVSLFISNKNKENTVKQIIQNYSLLDSAVYDRSGHKETQNKYLLSNRYFIKIQDGCQRFCSYCIVPYLRGLPKSKKISEIINEINKLDSGTKEVILTAINTEAYGLDTGEKFTDLISEVVGKTKIPRISFGSINPWSVDNNLYKVFLKYKKINRLLNFFHIPLQSGSDKVLKLMKRGYTSDEFKDKLGILKKISPLPLIATDVIVGFLGEGDKEFKETYKFLKDSPIDKFHVFKYSIRKGTAADYLSRKIKEPSMQIKKQRANQLLALGEKKYDKFIEKLIGVKSTVLFLNKTKDGYRQALLENQVPIWIKTSKNLNGQIKNIQVESKKNGCLFGKII